MRTAQEIKNDIVVLRLSGQLVGGPDAEAVRERIVSALRQGFRKVLLDLEEISWANSTGLGLLISAYIAATQEGGEVRLMRVSRRIDSILAITRLNTVFTTHPDEESALRAFGS